MHRGVFVLCRKKPSARRRRVRRCICIGLCVVILFTVYFEVAVRVQLTEVICTGMRTIAQRAVNEAVEDFLSENADVGEMLCELCFSDSGAVSAIRTDPAYINYVKADISERSQERIDQLAADEGIGVPLGSFSGLVFLSSVGPGVRMAVESTQTVSCTLASSFESAGINQTVHHIVLTAEVEIAVYSPYRIRKAITVSSDYEIAQTVIVGSVPSYSGVVTY